MADTPIIAARERIDRAIARIEAAVRARADAGAQLARRHAALRHHMVEAVAALDEVIAGGGGE